MAGFCGEVLGVRGRLGGREGTLSRVPSLPPRSFFPQKSDLLFDFGSLADSAAQIVQLCTSDLTDADDFHLLHVRRMDRERLFNADAVGNSAYREGFRDSAAVLTDYGTLEQLSLIHISEPTRP